MKKLIAMIACLLVLGGFAPVNAETGGDPFQEGEPRPTFCIRDSAPTVECLLTQIDGLRARLDNERTASTLLEAELEQQKANNLLVDTSLTTERTKVTLAETEIQSLSIRVETLGATAERASRRADRRLATIMRLRTKLRK